MLLARDYEKVLDMVFGVPSLPREVFYGLKRETKNVPIEGFEPLEDVKQLIMFLHKSSILRLFSPFFIGRLSKYFHKEVNHYYLIKFILTIALPSNYSEYQIMSRFYSKLEAHYKKGVAGIFLTSLQYGWISVGFAVALFVFPFGVIMAIFAYIIVRRCIKILDRIAPEISGNMNFQMTNVAMCIGAFSLIMASTFGLTDNLNLVYKNLQ